MKIRRVQSTFTNVEWNDLITLNETLAALEGKSKLGLKELSETNDIKFFESPEFKAFLVSAENYIGLLDESYPASGDTCVYCKQPLEEPAQKLLLSYKNLLNDTTELDLKKFGKSREDLIKR